jgi:hypothetical protein
MDWAILYILGDFFTNSSGHPDQEAARLGLENKSSSIRIPCEGCQIFSLVQHTETGKYTK